MAKFIRLKESKAFLNLEYVSLVTEQEDGSVAVEIIDQDKTQLFSGNDAANILAALKAADRYNATMFLYHSFPRKPHQQNLEMGLKILDSILKRGLLITPEEKEAPAYNNLPSRLFLQQRVCFTALERDELSGAFETLRRVQL